MTKKEDPRMHCSHCNALYGLENPRMRSVRNSKKFIALTKDNLKQPSLIMIVPRAHERKVTDLFRNKADKQEAEKFIAEVLGYCDKTLKCEVKAFQVIWKDGRESITISQPYTHLKTHAHAEIRISY